jgi:hypothetical protein
MLTKDEWELLEGLCKVLAGFAEATDYLGGSKYITHSVMNPLLKEIKKRIKPNISSRSVDIDIEEVIDVFEQEEEGEQAECEEELQNTSEKRLNLNEPLKTKKMLEKVKLNLYNAMELYWHQEGKELVSALLDPRTKSLAFIDNEEVCNEAKEILKNEYDNFKANSSLTTIHQTPINFQTAQTAQFNEPSIFSIFEEQNSSQDNNEITVYLSLPELNIYSDPFVWWRDHKERFPILSKLARIYLPVPATSTPSERLFSSAGNLLTAKRTRLNPELFNRLMFLKKNASFVESIHPKF